MVISKAISQQSFDDICLKVDGKTTAEVAELLGKPDSQEKLPIGELRWIWWNYTFLKGDNYPPEIRDKPIHLEIMFSNPSEAEEVPDSQWKVSGPLAVSYAIPQVPQAPEAPETSEEGAFLQSGP